MTRSRLLLASLAFLCLGNTDCEGDYVSRRCTDGTVSECTDPDPRWTDVGYEVGPLCEYLFDDPSWDPVECARALIDPFIPALEEDPSE